MEGKWRGDWGFGAPPLRSGCAAEAAACKSLRGGAPNP